MSQRLALGGLGRPSPQQDGCTASTEGTTVAGQSGGGGGEKVVRGCVCVHMYVHVHVQISLVTLYQF
jgi:hypothetical protein